MVFVVGGLTTNILLLYFSHLPIAGVCVCVSIALVAFVNSR